MTAEWVRLQAAFCITALIFSAVFGAIGFTRPPGAAGRNACIAIGLGMVLAAIFVSGVCAAYVTLESLAVRPAQVAA